MTHRKRIFKVFWAWQDHPEEIWLNHMAKQGWALRSYKYVYTFDKIEPANYIYRLDYKRMSNRELNEYKQLFQETGWEYVTHYGNWHYFRTIPTTEKTPEIYTENEYQIEKYKSLLLQLIVGLLTTLTVIIFSVVTDRSLFLQITSICLLALFILCLFKVKQKMNRLKE